ncbi:protealysin inhibitor emfourin [Arthrobacter sp. Ld5]|uniref:protealysin inhibitor emfourin n=1 Tax=Arthrobacter sp. Ld5 TaxID=649152 RepID=UPI003EB921FC
MRIEITRSGGVGGLTRTWSLEVSREEAEERWLPLAEAEASAETRPGEAARQPDTGPPGPSRDRFTYRITVGYTEVSVPESRLAAPWRELIDRARAGTRGGPATGPGARPAPGAEPSSEGGHGTPEELL